MKNASLRISACLLAASFHCVYADDVLDCAKRSLADAVAKEKNGAIVFTGVCAGPIRISTEGVKLTGTGSAVIDGRGQDAVVIAGAHEVGLANLEVRNGVNGVLGQNGAHVTLDHVVSRNNTVNGVSLQTGSSAVITDSSARDNGLHGLDLETGSAATVTGSFAATGNRVFGLNVNGSSITFSRATLTASGNALGMQVATSANAFLNDGSTVLNFLNNLATGLTVVSGGHMVSFGGKINATGNGAFGVSVNSKGGLDLDAGSVLTATSNGAGGLALQQQSVMTVFNNPQFSGAPGFSTVNTQNNTGNGIAVLTSSTLTLANQAQINSTGNGAVGLLADNGAGATLRNTTLTGNTVRDLQMTFGTRVDAQVGLTVGTYSCDATVLVRGGALTCPK
jgi:hypothetical protein